MTMYNLHSYKFILFMDHVVQITPCRTPPIGIYPCKWPSCSAQERSGPHPDDDFANQARGGPLRRAPLRELGVG